MKSVVYAVWYERADVKLYAEKQDAKNALWSYYMSEYSATESDEEQREANEQLEEQDSIEFVGFIEELEVR